MNNCIFCKIIKNEIATNKVYEDDDILAFNDINPKAPLHILIIPKKHIPSLEYAKKEDIEVLGKMQIVAKEIAIKNGVIKDGVRLVLNCNKGAGQEVFHIHYHLLGGRTFTWPPG
ncbi:MAG: histidine triad nucleotide-binding protein [Candidatus Hydrogenedentota bacterium]